MGFAVYHIGMTDRRSGPPLFDLMRERGERPAGPRPQQPSNSPQGTEKKADAPVSPAKQPVAKPEIQTPAVKSETRQTAWDSTGGVSRAERSAAAMLDEDVQTDTGILLSTPKFYTMIAIGLVLIVGAWAGGYQIGFGDGKDEMSQFVRNDQPVVRPSGSSGQTSGGQDTATTDESSPPETRSNQQPSQSTGTVPSQPRSGAGSPSPTAILTPTGYRSDDPRTPGLNYLVLATLTPEQAADAIQFMQANGITIIGVPRLDSGGQSANNPSRYTLYSLGLAIPGNRWSAMSNQRLEHQNKVASLGARWQRERQGGSDFSQTNWEKYEP